MDLTTLAGDDTEQRVFRLAAKARRPVQPAIIEQLGATGLEPKVAAVCVYHQFVETAKHALEGSGIRVAAVSAGPTPRQCKQVPAQPRSKCTEAGAKAAGISGSPSPAWKSRNPGWHKNRHRAGCKVTIVNMADLACPSRRSNLQRILADKDPSSQKPTPA